MSISSDIKLKFINKYQVNFRNPQEYYEIIAKIGQGSYGEVFKARVKNTEDEIVALKRLTIDDYCHELPKSIHREVSILKKLEHENIINLMDVCYAESTEEFNFQTSFYLVFDFCTHDLSGLLANSEVVFTLGEIKNMMKQLMNAVNFVHSKKILHRDLKCANLLFTKTGILKLADFGLSRCFDESKASSTDTNFTNIVVSLWYRAPELLLGSTNYGPSIDMWSIGCIMAEMFRRKPLFRGYSEQNQLYLITAVCGSITPSVWPNVQELDLYCNMELLYNQKRCLMEKLTLCVGNEDALSLISNLLQLDPSRRPCANDALEHDFFFNDPLPCSLQMKLSKLTDHMFDLTVNYMSDYSDDDFYL